MEKKYINIFNGYRDAYGVADMTHPEAKVLANGKKKPVYRWAYEKFTDQVYIDHINGKESV